MRYKKYDPEAGHSYTFGVFPTLELLRYRQDQLTEVLLTAAAERNEGVAKIRALCDERGIPVEVNDKQVERIAPKDNTYAVGVFDKYAPRLDARADHLVLVNPGDMGNLGTILRTMVAFNLTNLAIIRPAVDIFDPRAVRASMGALFAINFIYCDSFEDYRSAYGDHYLYPFMTDGAVDVHQMAFGQPFTLVFGNESSGLPSIYHTWGASVRIPFSPAVDSLNLSVAVGIALYEATRGRV
jgi:TrmH family RNA methyltransferase